VAVRQQLAVYFDVNGFYDEITNSINRAVWRVKNNRQAQKEWFRVTYHESFFEFTKERRYFLMNPLGNVLSKSSQFSNTKVKI